ncbi:MAG: ligase-associated DNA damage response endonuclease PdeM [Flavobacteriales bacterium]
MIELGVEIGGQTLSLGDRYMRIGDILVIADLHLGKTMHFRKSGLPIPARARDADQSNLISLLNDVRPKKLLVLGDLFHSSSNSECEELAMITSRFADVEFELVMGNHDILAPEVYRSLDFETCDRWSLHNFLFTHEPMEDVPDGIINIHGHIHPGIRLFGKGRQSMLLPCFHLQPAHFCIPAYGMLTGLMRRHPAKGDRVFALLPDAVTEMTI